MKDLQWNDEYSLGIPAIDLQHRQIFESIMAVAAGPSESDGLRAEAEILRLLGLLQEHFALEENMMRTLHYPELEAHIEEHREFHADVHDLAQRSLRHKGGVPREALKVAHRWLKEHINESDRHYLDFFANALQQKGREKRKKHAAKEHSE